MTEKNLTLDRRQMAKALSVGAASLLLAGKPALAAEDLANTLYMQLKDGRVVIRLRPDIAPACRAHQDPGEKGLLRRHRLPSRDRRLHGPDRRPDRHRHGRLRAAQRASRVFQSPLCARHAWYGALAVAQFGQFAILHLLRPGTFLDGQYTVFGEVVSGMEFVDKIKRGEPPANPDKIISLKLASEV